MMRPQPTANATTNPSNPEVKPPVFDDSPNAISKHVKTVSGPYTYGRLNEIPAEHGDFTLGLADDMGSRRSMEDTHAFVFDFAETHGQGLFAVFDGHSGKHAAEWCGTNFHEFFLRTMRDHPNLKPAEALSVTYVAVDAVLTKFAEDGVTASGCTAVTAFLRIEDEHGRQPWLTAPPPTPTQPQAEPSKTPSGSGKPTVQRFMDALGAGQRGRREKEAAPTKRAVKPTGNYRRVLYTANAGDARAVLSRAGRAVRLSYDHKGSDRAEVERIRKAGGFVLNSRINGVLAVTRSLGDTSMKDYVIGKPYTTECELTNADDLLIVACDGVWDVTDDQTAVEICRAQPTAEAAAQALKQHAQSNYTQDNITVMVVKFAWGKVVGQGKA